MQDEKNFKFFRSLRCAGAGLKESWRTEPSFRTHVAAFIFVGVLLSVVRPVAVWWALLTLISGAVLAAELVNTAIEKLIDHLHPQKHERIRVIKDTLAAGVLALAVSAIAVFAAFLTALGVS